MITTTEAAYIKRLLYKQFREVIDTIDIETLTAKSTGTNNILLVELKVPTPNEIPELVKKL